MLFLCFVLEFPGVLEIVMINTEINSMIPSETSPKGTLALLVEFIYDVVSKPITVKAAKNG